MLAKSERAKTWDVDDFLIFHADCATCLGIHFLGFQLAVSMTDRLNLLRPVSVHVPLVSLISTRTRVLTRGGDPVGAGQGE